MLIEYYPYGAEYSVNGGGWTNFGFIDKETDYTKNLDFGPRYFSATSGHFMSPDPILAAPSAYAYTNGNPIMMSDPSGLQSGPGWLPIYVQQQLDFERSLRSDMAMLQSDAENEAYMMETLYRSGQSAGRGQLKSYNDLVLEAGYGNRIAAKKLREIQSGQNEDYVNIVFSNRTVRSQVNTSFSEGEVVSTTFTTVGRVQSRYAFGTSAPGGVPTVGYPMPNSQQSTTSQDPALTVLLWYAENVDTPLHFFVAGGAMMVTGGAMVVGGVVGTIGAASTPIAWIAVPITATIAVEGLAILITGVDFNIRTTNYLYGTNIPKPSDLVPGMFPEWPERK